MQQAKKLILLASVMAAGALVNVAGAALEQPTVAATATSVTISGTENNPPLCGPVTVGVFDIETHGERVNLFSPWLFPPDLNSLPRYSYSYSFSGLEPNTTYGWYVFNANAANCHPGQLDGLFATSTEPAAAPVPQPPGRYGYCAPNPVLRADGTLGTFVDILLSDLSNPLYAGATPASYIEGIGLTCDPAPVGYTRTGKVDGSGHPAAGDTGTTYAFYAKKG